MAKKKATGGRRKGGHNTGLWYREGRGWVVTEGRSAILLRDDSGNSIKRRDQKEEAKKAHARYLVEKEKQQRQAAIGDSMLIGSLAQRYLAHAKKHDKPGTHQLRGKYLFDFTTGFPARFWKSDEEPKSSDRLHEGYGRKTVSEIIPHDVNIWLDAHPGWGPGGRRAAIQALRRMFYWGAEEGLLQRNPMQRFKTPVVGKRITYFTPEQEAALLANANRAAALAIRVLIRTGVRPVSEFAALEARHVQETERGQCWRFEAHEHKTGRQTGRARVIYVHDDIAEEVRNLVKRHPEGKVFRNSRGKAWTKSALQSTFKRLRQRLASQGTTLDDDASAYTCRHTFAKRMLGGYWGKAVTLEVLAGLMGNSPKACWEHYSRWADQYTEPLWNAVNGI